MPLPEGYVPRKGDVLALSMTVEWLSTSDGPRVYGRVGGAESGSFCLASFDHVVSYSLSPGDHVRIEGFKSLGTILALYVDMAWVRLDETPPRQPITISISSLERVDDDATERSNEA